MAEVKSGEQTTEFKEAQSAKLWGALSIILGLVLSVGAQVADSLGADSKLGVIAGAVVAVAGIMYRTLVSLGYIKARADVKAASKTEGPELL